MVAVVGDVRYDGYERDLSPLVYQPYAQEPRRHGGAFTLTARTTGEPGRIIRRIEVPPRTAPVVDSCHQHNVTSA